jgi:hypothetical protein
MKIVSNGCGHISFSIDGEDCLKIMADDPVKVTIDHECISIDSQPGFFINANNRIVLNGSYNNININGVIIQGNRSDNSLCRQVGAHPDPSYKKDWSIPIDPQFSVDRVALNGSASLYFSDNIFNPDTKFVIAGSGNIEMGCSHSLLKRIDATISGSGDIDFDDASIEELHVSISGSGNIKNFIVTHVCRANITGSGNVKGKSAKGASINRNVRGSGQIKISANT